MGALQSLVVIIFAETPIPPATLSPNSSLSLRRPPSASRSLSLRRPPRAPPRRRPDRLLATSGWICAKAGRICLASGKPRRQVEPRCRRCLASGAPPRQGGRGPDPRQAGLLSLRDAAATLPPVRRRRAGALRFAPEPRLLLCAAPAAPALSSSASPRRRRVNSTKWEEIADALQFEPRQQLCD